MKPGVLCLLLLSGCEWFLGYDDEVERNEIYHRDHDAGIEPASAQPHFQERSLFTKA